MFPFAFTCQMFASSGNTSAGMPHILVLAKQRFAMSSGVTFIVWQLVAAFVMHVMRGILAKGMLKGQPKTVCAMLAPMQFYGNLVGALVMAQAKAFSGEWVETIIIVITFEMYRGTYLWEHIYQLKPDDRGRRARARRVGSVLESRVTG